MTQRQLPTIEQLEPAAREFCRLMGADPDEENYDMSQPFGNTWRKSTWCRQVAKGLREAIATRWALDVFERSVSQNANGETQTDLSSTGETRKDNK